METLLHVATKEVGCLQGVCRLAFQMNSGFHIFLSPLSVRWWWWMAVVEPAGWCCCPCSGLCRVVCSPGVTFSLKELPPLLPLWTWPEPFLWNVRSWCLALLISQLIKRCWNIVCVWISSTHKKNKLFNSIDVDQFLGSIKATLGSLLERYTGAEITDKLGSSILATLFRQQVPHPYCDLNGFVLFWGFFITLLFIWLQYLLWSWQIILLLELCFLDIPHSLLLKSFSSLVELLRSLSTDTGDIFSKVCQITEFTTSHSLCENAYNIGSYRTMYHVKRGCVSKIFVFWRILGFPVKCDPTAMTASPMILHYRCDLFKLKHPLSLSDCKCFVRWTRRPGISPSSQWCWGPGMWNPLTTMRTAVMRPPSMLAPVLHHLKWSLMSAVRQRRGGIK